jgi:hypothetical protein
VFHSYKVVTTTLSAEGLAGVKKGRKRGTTKTTRNDYEGAGNEIRVEMDKGRGRVSFRVAIQ